MGTFPKSEDAILAAAQELIGGLTDNPTIFPSPPVTAVELQAILDSCIALRDQANAARAAAELVTQTKDAGLEELADAMRADYGYAETAVTDPAQLQLIGWEARKTPSPPQVPGAPRAFEAAQQGEGWVFLDWKSPATGGPVVSYQVERRERPAGDWVIAGMALKSELMLTNQERGKDLEYRVIAVNNTGSGEPSATVPVVL
jgi:hypothetical protein